MTTSQRNKRITLQSPSGSRDSVGERSTAWTTVAVVWANVRTPTGRELVVAAQRQQITDHVIELLYGTTIAALDASWRVLYGSRVLTIESAINVDQKNESFILYCSEGKRTE